MEIHECEQRSEEWFALRIGRITGTRIKELAGGQKPTVETLCLKIAAEKLTGTSSEKPFTLTPAMEKGIELEDEARREYEIQTMRSVREVGFVSRDDLYGVSPDGLVRDNKGYEGKAPMAHTHLKYLMADGKAWRAYRWQVQGSLWVTGFDSWDFCSYCPDFEEGKRLLIETVKPDPDDMATLDERSEFAKKRISEILEHVQ